MTNEFPNSSDRQDGVRPYRCTGENVLRLTRVTLVAKTMSKRFVANFAQAMHRAFGSISNTNFGIFMYHRIVDDIAGIERLRWNVTPSKFREQMSGLLQQGFEPWPLRRVIEHHLEGKELPRKIFVITFDDGYESVYLNAWPVLRNLKIPATMFVATAYLDRQTPFPFDDWAGAGLSTTPIESWRPLNSAQIEEMTQSGLLELGAHTHTHRDFSDCPSEFQCDLAMNIDLLRTNFRVLNPAFAFPYGKVNAALMNTAKDSSVCCALTTFAVPNRAQDSPFGWGRFDVDRWDTSATLAAKLGGWYSFAPKLRQSLQDRLSFQNPFKTKRASCVR